MKKRNVLLLEPNYKNKYPPIGLMKLATYHRMLGDKVVFFKGDLKEFILNQISIELIKKLTDIDNNVNWIEYKKSIVEYIKKSSIELLKSLIQLSKYDLLVSNWLISYKDYYRKKQYLDNPKWDRICITTLFTFNWNITIETIEFAKKIVKNKSQILIGGVLATVLAEDVEKETGIKTHKGLLNEAGDLDKNEIIIDELPLDYSILGEIDYAYPENNAYYGYMTRGCVRKCSFCAVWKIEPKFNPYISLKEKIEKTKRDFGDQRNLLLLDNNVLASKNFTQIIEEIKESGFVKGAKFIDPNYLDIAVRNLKTGINDVAYLKMSFELIQYLLQKLKGEKQQELYDILDESNLLSSITATKSNILRIYPKIKGMYEKYRNRTPKLRYVDFNQGLDARLLTEIKMQLLSEIPIKPLRIAFDSMGYEKTYVKAIRLAAKHNIRNLSNYLLYNEKDEPKELYQRLEINILLSEELDINIYSFPMKFHPINGEKHLNRSYLGENWNRKYIRAIQTVLNATKGKIGRGKSFFYKAFGKDINEFEKILIMPETYILFRYFFEDSGYTENWWNEFESYENSEKEKIKIIIKNNEFKGFNKNGLKKQSIDFIEKHYLISREDIKNPKSKYYKEKEEYDLSKTIA
ncbi:MAG: hypothetical protein HN704_06285 [Bacteroidetes bacterium]|jgi:hypothetical protein|nr:hypothetical protein [Bacteroidota bacterium]MBT6686208.1 hypothetical protein [Bacteroidota bacterium]MBT7143646.1 hypothetical protein [Bacteroidota bacterium]MBT7491196.1 hypothetical protein [Bacteroidota bacterium]